MKKFLIKLSLFFVLLLLFSFLLWGYCHTDKPIVKMKEKVLILGDSHTEFAINDTIFTNSFNYSQAADPFIYSYVKLINITSVSKIDTLILSVSLFTIMDDGRIKEKCMRKMNKLLFRFPWEDLTFLFRYNRQIIWGSFISYFTETKIGGYSPSSEFKLQKSLQFLITQTLQNLSIPHEAQLLYLDKIVKYCKSKSIKLIFINTPMYHAEKFYNMDNFYKIIQERYNNITFWDYGDYILPDSCYRDADHLNYIGAEIFSAMLQKEVRNKSN
jgi:hypothetical protein